MTIAAVRPADRYLHGLRIRAPLDLEDLPPCPDDGAPPDLTIRLEQVPDALPDPVYSNPFVTVSAGGQVRYAVPGVGVCLVERPDLIVLQAAPGATPADIRLMLDAGPLAVVCYQRGLLPMHAAAVRIGERTVLLAGASGCGKSTLAACLMARGHPVLADDLCAIDAGASGGPRVFPGLPRIKLWADTIDVLGLAGRGYRQLRPGIEKFHVPAGDAYCTSPQRVDRVLLLGDADPARPAGWERLAGAKALSGLRYGIFRPRLGELLGRAAAMMAASCRIVEGVPLLLLRREKAAAGLPALADLVERLAGEG